MKFRELPGVPVHKKDNFQKKTIIFFQHSGGAKIFKEFQEHCEPWFKPFFHTCPLFKRFYESICFLAYFSPDCCAETINSCKNHPVSFPVPLTVEPSRLLCPMVTWVRLPNRLVTNLKVSVCPRRSTLFLALFSITYSWDFLSSPSRTIQAFCVVPAFCLSLVRKVSSNAMTKKRKLVLNLNHLFLLLLR